MDYDNLLNTIVGIIIIWNPYWAIPEWIMTIPILRFASEFLHLLCQMFSGSFSTGFLLPKHTYYFLNDRYHRYHFSTTIVSFMITIIIIRITVTRIIVIIVIIITIIVIIILLIFSIVIIPKLWGIIIIIITINTNTSTLHAHAHTQHTYIMCIYIYLLYI